MGPPLQNINCLYNCISASGSERLEFGPPEDVVRRLQSSPGARRLPEEVGKFTLRQGMVPADDFIAQVDQKERQPASPGRRP